MSDRQDLGNARREFLTRCGQYSLATSPLVALMLATAERSYAKARSDAFRDLLHADGAPSDRQGLFSRPLSPGMTA